MEAMTLQRYCFVIADVVLFIFREAMHEERSFSRPEQDDGPKASGFAGSRPSNALLDDAATDVGVDQATIGIVILRRGAAGHAALDFPSREALGPDDQAGGPRCEAGGADGGSDAVLAIQLHRAGVDAAGLGDDRGAGMALDEQGSDAVGRQEDGGGQADGAAAERGEGAGQPGFGRVACGASQPMVARGSLSVVGR
jgi:hypothetical protein